MSFTDVLKKAYPFLTIAASMVPGGNIATSVLGQVLKLKQGDTLDAAGIAALNAPPEVKAQLQAEENRHSEAVQQMGIQSAEEYERIATADRADARNREIQVRDSTPKLIAASVLVAAIAVESYTAWAVFHRVTFSNDGAVIIGRILGMLDTSVGLILAYYFGSSAGSAAKTAIMAQNGNGGK